MRGYRPGIARSNSSIRSRPRPPTRRLASTTPTSPRTRSWPTRSRPSSGYDFSRVRVHTDARAAEAARAVRAHASTQGEHIVFAGGRYAPRTAEGLRLVGHELAHVVQQSAGRVASSRGHASIVTDPR